MMHPDRGLLQPRGLYLAALKSSICVSGGGADARLAASILAAPCRGIPMLRIVDIINKNIASENMHRVPPELSMQYRRTILKGGEIVISLVGTIGRVAQIPTELAGANVHRNLGVIAPREHINGRFVLLCLSSPVVQEQIAGFTTGGNQPLFNLGDLKKVAMPVPSLEEQGEIVRRVEALFKIADAVEERYREAWGQLERLPQAVLAKAFRGELVPQEPGDEPASALLERISAKKESGGKVSRKTKQPQRRPGRNDTSP